MGFGSLIGGLFGKSSEESYDKLSVAELSARIDEKQQRAEDVRELLRRMGGDQAAMDKSLAWSKKMELMLQEAERKLDLAAQTKIKAEIAEAHKRRKKIEESAAGMSSELQSIEDEIELLSRALDNKKK